MLAGETPAIIAFPFQDAPEALHRAVIDAMRHTGHTLRHSRLHELVVESAVGVLASSVTMEQRMRVRCSLYSLIKSLENQRIIVISDGYSADAALRHDHDPESVRHRCGGLHDLQHGVSGRSHQKDVHAACAYVRNLSVQILDSDGASSDCCCLAESGVGKDRHNRSAARHI